MEIKTRDLRSELILETVVQWCRADRQGVEDFIQNTRIEKAGQRHESGKWRVDAGAVKWKMPQVLLDCIRMVFEAHGIDEIFGRDDKDMKFLVQNFPDLFKYAHNCSSWRGKKATAK